MRGLSKNFDGLRAISDISTVFEANKVHAIIGPNGAGKTTFINLLSGAIVVDKNIDDLVDLAERHVVLAKGEGPVRGNLETIARRVGVCESHARRLTRPSVNRPPSHDLGLWMRSRRHSSEIGGHVPMTIVKATGFDCRGSATRLTEVKEPSLISR
ncbi:ATP-binding cassette domain-containing protein [Bradyrhizobium sp.]|uniref:ATP-binding cassette domain-containing protein n=1 Tax=Bradyrhizobium sp. TaxID=376 RepID=UPI003C7199A6